LTGGPVTGLVLSGGGARAAYQVGVLKALMRMRREAGADDGVNPFPVICGTSAGAINAAALACRADDAAAAVQDLCAVWENFEAEQVYRADSLGVIRSGAQWLTMLSVGWLVARWRRVRPKSLLDNSPLAELLTQAVPLERLEPLLRQGHLQALAVTASSYTSGEHVTFYQAAQRMQPWSRTQRRAVPACIGLPHLLASSAIPFVFPSTELEREGSAEWFGDGSMRQTAPISPAIHLGATRVLVIGAGRMQEPSDRRVVNRGYPSLAQIAGHAMSSIFLDALAVDIERLERINRTLALLPQEALQGTALRPVQALVISPSQRLDDIAGRHQARLPLPVRTLLRGVGVTGQGREAQGATLASYLLFEAEYTRELMALGEADADLLRQQVLEFFGWGADAGGMTPAARAA
jgi:NTE family protein